MLQGSSSPRRLMRPQVSSVERSSMSQPMAAADPMAPAEADPMESADKIQSIADSLSMEEKQQLCDLLTSELEANSGESSSDPSTSTPASDVDMDNEED